MTMCIDDLACFKVLHQDFTTGWNDQSNYTQIWVKNDAYIPLNQISIQDDPDIAVSLADIIFRRSNIYYQAQQVV